MGKVHSDVRLKGIFLQEGEQVGLIDRESGAEQLDLLEDERKFESEEVIRERCITSPDSNEKIVEALRDFCQQHEAKYGRFPKTLVFAAHDLPHISHADQLVRICVDVFGRGEASVQKITGRADRPLQRIREFRNRQNPGIVVSVDLMSTGVDIPDLEIIVFLRPVQSRILFEQMLGRGTRKGERHPDKSHFTVFDCFGGTLLERFKQATAITAEVPVGPSRTVAEIIEDIWNNRDRQYNIRCLVKRLHRIDKEMAGEARNEFKPYIPDGDLAAYAKALPERLANDFVNSMTLLRDKQFQHVLVNYTRKKDTFIKAIGTQDTVTTEWLLRDGAGRELKPEDYLAIFARFVQETVGAVHHSHQPCWPIDTTYFVEEVPELDMGFVHCALNTLGLSEMDTSSAIPGLNREDVFAQVLPLAPLAEQKRIVAKVEALLARVNAARERLAKTPALLKRFRQSVLAAACSGQLTADWREENPNVGSAKEQIRDEQFALSESEEGLPELQKHGRGLPSVRSRPSPEYPTCCRHSLRLARNRKEWNNEIPARACGFREPAGVDVRQDLCVYLATRVHPTPSC